MYRSEIYNSCLYLNCKFQWQLFCFNCTSLYQIIISKMATTQTRHINILNIIIIIMLIDFYNSDDEDYVGTPEKFLILLLLQMKCIIFILLQPLLQLCIWTRYNNILEIKESTISLTDTFLGHRYFDYVSKRWTSC